MSQSVVADRTTAVAVFMGNSLSLFWTIAMSLGLAALTSALDGRKVWVSMATSSAKL